MRYLSVGHAEQLALGEWKESLLSMQHRREAEPWSYDPVERTGYYAIVDRDLPPEPGTRLALLTE